MKLDQLEALAKAAIDEPNHGRLQYFITEFYNAANPQTIKQLIALVRLQHSVIESTETEMRYAGFSQHESDNAMRKQVHEEALKALAAYEQFGKEK